MRKSFTILSFNFTLSLQSINTSKKRVKVSTGTKIKRTIELNGKLYDARTGKIIGGTEAASAAKGTPKPAPAQHSTQPASQAVDGFKRRSHTVTTTVKVHAPVSKAPVQTAAAKPDVSRPAPAPQAAKLEKSRTLMRTAVKKPKPVVDHYDTSGKHAHFKKENPHRKLRAHAASKSSLVQRFNPDAQLKVVKKEAVLPVATQKPAISRQLSSEVARLATSTEAQVKHSVDIIEESLRHATSHLEKFEDRVSRSTFWDRVGFRNKTANIGSLAFAGLLLVGFFAYQNVPSVEMKMAATRSGVSASLPGYKPAGFSAAKEVKSEPGKVSATFFSNSSDKKFTVTQQASNWSSDSLLTNHVLAGKRPFQTYQDAGKTVYIYDNSNATWVNGGTWYKIDGNASLSSDQLLRIANSF